MNNNELSKQLDIVIAFCGNICKRTNDIETSELASCIETLARIIADCNHIEITQETI